MTPEEYETRLQALERGSPLERLAAKRTRQAQAKIRDHIQKLTEYAFSGDGRSGGLNDLVQDNGTESDRMRYFQGTGGEGRSDRRCGQCWTGTTTSPRRS